MTPKDNGNDKNTAIVQNLFLLGIRVVYQRFYREFGL
jgi:hypothetical protein